MHTLFPYSILAFDFSSGSLWALSKPVWSFKEQSVLNFSASHALVLFLYVCMAYSICYNVPFDPSAYKRCPTLIWTSVLPWSSMNKGHVRRESELGFHIHFPFLSPLLLPSRKVWHPWKQIEMHTSSLCYFNREHKNQYIFETINIHVHKWVR